MAEKKSSKVTLTIGVISFLVSVVLLFNGRILIGIFGGITSIEILRQGLRDKKTNANNTSGK